MRLDSQERTLNSSENKMKFMIINCISKFLKIIGRNSTIGFVLG